MKKQVLNLTNAISTAGALHWHIFGGNLFVKSGAFARLVNWIVSMTSQTANEKALEAKLSWC